jgi:hypothetical protein
MRFIVMHKVDANMEAGGPPSQEIVTQMGELVQGSLKEGVFLNGAGLHRSARRARLERRGQNVEVTTGPYAGKNELVASLAMIIAPSLEDAVEHAKTLAASLGDVGIEVGPVVAPWDIGVMPKPEKLPPAQFLLLCKSTPADEAGDTSKKHAKAMQELQASLGDQAALLATETLAPSRSGSRARSAPRGERVWVDGPFAESKELIAGFSLLRLGSKQEALAWATRYAAILPECEVDVREVYEP